jgi:hypothetical protein
LLWIASGLRQNACAADLFTAGEWRLSEVRVMIEARRLYSLRIGLTDAHLIASVYINSPTLLWTRDKRLRSVAEGLGVHAGF